MPFNVILAELAKRSGAEGAVLLSFDGEVVASFAASPAVEIDLIGAHNGVIFSIVQDAAARLKEPDAVKAVSISTENSRLTISALKEGLCLVLSMNKSRHLGKALTESRKAIAKIEKELG